MQEEARPEILVKMEQYLTRYSTETFGNITDVNILASITRFKNLCIISDSEMIDGIKLNTGELMIINMEIGALLDDMEALGVPEAIKLNNESRLRNSE